MLLITRITQSKIFIQQIFKKKKKTETKRAQIVLQPSISSTHTNEYTKNS